MSRQSSPQKSVFVRSAEYQVTVRSSPRDPAFGDVFRCSCRVVHAENLVQTGGERAVEGERTWSRLLPCPLVPCGQQLELLLKTSQYRTRCNYLGSRIPGEYKDRLQSLSFSNKLQAQSMQRKAPVMC